tara:strand:- start:1402 stop:2706 length:1305 start_codon:yes stop_codon:yes gene_type:complete
MKNSKNIEKIVSASGKSREEIVILVDQKKERFSGLLTESGAALMVAKELGVELGLEEQGLEKLTLNQLKEGMNNVEIVTRVNHVFSPKSFEKNGKKGVLCTLIVCDSTGETRLTVWGKEVAFLQENKVEKGSILLLKNCYVKNYNGVPRLNLSYNGKISLGSEAVGLPEANERKVLIKELGEKESDVSVIGRVLNIFPEKEFEKEGGTGKLVNFILGDASGTVRVTAWNSMVNEVKKLSPEQTIKIEGAYTKQGLRSIELQLGFRARILRNPKEGSSIPLTADIKGIETQEKKIAKLSEKDRSVQLSAEVLDILPGKLRFNVCPECGKKVESIDGNYLCEQCGEVTPDIRAVVSLTLKDDSGKINAALFAELAEKAIGLNKEELKKRLEVNTAEQLIAEAKEKIVGKKIKVGGFAKINSYSNKLEFSAREFSFS